VKAIFFFDVTKVLEGFFETYNTGIYDSLRRKQKPYGAKPESHGPTEPSIVT